MVGGALVGGPKSLNGTETDHGLLKVLSQPILSPRDGSSISNFVGRSVSVSKKCDSNSNSRS